MKGHVRRRGNKWCFVIDIPTDNGERRQKWFSGYRSRKDAEKEMVRVINELEKGTFVEPSNEKYRDYLKTWLEGKKSTVKPATYDTYFYLISKHIAPKLGHISISKINAVHLQRFYSYLNDKEHLAPASISKIHNIIKASLNAAYRYGFIYKNPALLVDPPRIGRKEMRFWTEEQARHFLNVAKNDRLYIAFFLAITTGMRKGEILGLRWKDIDLQRKTITINQTLSNRGDRFQETKTNAGRRTIVLTGNTIDVLKQHYLTIKKEKLKNGRYYEDHGLVVCTSLGTPIIPRNFDRVWKRLLKESGLPEIRFHDLRHTHATILLKQGIHPKVVSERLGHANIRITLDTYSHVLPGLQEAAAAKFEELFFHEKDISESES
jgi:integrase